ncbi:D-glycero-beta-D-manno-heptose 1,7-bisphosphate 7-phosphatase [Sansalvadorimonas sp. 2012CJ34-2]|uniref:D,D-heptose 1,7-bisphosphate phosphatase n=1 Tax=Parendozoicomonas callyspongiae TaxID=2942213 RepID=A0ABT0PBC6_9GAMM|nr:D-glycero-beta-D-manno-heptose 1,7-bisphosphate 7-phosphatase [Sansalvadorimonas sp. 2012CJ34-2]MCL6268551.1 D-glycero-beta-D-manno-heptose 1,7-bisphosphate 7-phosphatase [Sansalvadorimonas sp. 2012CJ34-2]
MKLIILDRDGVINEDSDNYIKSVDEWQPVPGSIEAIANLSKAGFTIAVATNQSGLGRGYYSQQTLNDMHGKMLGLVEEQGGSIACIKFCPHTPVDNCDCRKPQPGLVRQIEKELDVSSAGAWFVGDSAKDIEVARSCDCLPVLVKSGKGMRTLSSGMGLNDVAIFDNLLAFSKSVIRD